MNINPPMAFTIWRRSRLNAIGIIVLLVGLGAGDLIYWHARPETSETDEEILAMQQQTKAYPRAAEQNVGAFGALLAQWSDGLAQLGQSKPFAVTLMVVSCPSAGGCFWVASRQPG